MSGPESTTPNGSEQNPPLWRQHFPIDTSKDDSRSRREFIGGLAVAGGAMVCGQAALNSVVPAGTGTAEFQPHAPIALEKKLTDLQNGEALLFHFPNEKSPCLLVKLADSEIVAFTQKCTHLACPVIPDVEAGRFQCPCHKGSFDMMTGRPVAGPPQTPLTRVRIEVAEDATLMATGMETA